MVTLMQCFKATNLSELRAFFPNIYSDKPGGIVEATFTFKLVLNKIASVLLSFYRKPRLCCCHEPSV